MAFAISLPRAALAQIGKGGDQAAPNEVGNAYKSDVRNKLGKIIIRLAESWDSADPDRATRLYTNGATITFGPGQSVAGKAAIAQEFVGRFQHMHGLVLTVDGFDQSGELSVIRGEMSFDLVHPDNRTTQENSVYTMTFKLQRGDEWLIDSHMISGSAPLSAWKETASGR